MTMLGNRNVLGGFHSQVMLAVYMVVTLSSLQ